MAVSDKEIAVLRAKQNAIAGELERTRIELEKARNAVTAQNRKQLEALRAETAHRIQEREQRVLEQYEEILEENTSRQEYSLEQEFRKYQKQYDEITMAVSSAFAEEQRKNEEMLIRQKQFEKAYFARREFARERAQNSRKKAESAVRQTAVSVPLEWFLPGHMDLYRNRLLELAQWMQNGFYESVIGIAENLLLLLHLDELEAEKQFRRWFHYYTMLYQALDAEKQLLFESALQVPESLADFRQNPDAVKDNRLTSEFMNLWSDGQYQNLLDAYAKTYADVAQFAVNGCPLLNEQEMRRFMIAHPEKSVQYQETAVYHSAVKAVQHLANAEKQIQKIHNRMQNFNDRLHLMKAVRKALSANGYHIRSVSFFENQPANPLMISFCDSMQILSFELLLIPVLRRTDDIWVNQAVCFTAHGCEESRISELEHLLAKVLVVSGIGIQYEQMHESQNSGERVKIAVTDVKLKINARLN